MIDELNRALDQIPDLRHRVRRLKWFQHFFKEEADALGRKYNYEFVVNNRSLSEAFLKWAEVFEADRVDAPRDRNGFTVFAGGLMLRELLRAAPVQSRVKGKVAECIPADPMVKICDLWPEGLLCVTCCMAVVRAILKTDFDTNVVLSPFFEDLRAWESFRENVREDVGLAVPFFDLFLGREPNWTGPEYFRARPGMRDADFRAALAEKPVDRS